MMNIKRSWDSAYKGGKNAGKTVVLEEVPLTEAGGKVFYTIHAPKKPDTERLALEYGKVSELSAYQSDLVEMVNMYERNFDENDFIASLNGASGSANGVIIQRGSVNDFPKIGLEQGIYVDTSSSKIYYWKDGAYHIIFTELQPKIILDGGNA